MTQKRPTKQEVMNMLLSKDPSVFMHFDPRCEGVLLPPHLRRQPRVVLQYGLNMPVPIPDLEVSAEGLGATLSFQRTPTWTFVPWSAVFAIVNDEGQGMLWETDVPREVREEPAPPAAATGPAKKSGKAEPRGAKKNQGARPLLRAVEGGAPKGDEPKLTLHRAPDPVEPSEPEKIDEKPASEPRQEAAQASAPSPREPRESDEIVEPPAAAAKKKRELPPWLRVVK